MIHIAEFMGREVRVSKRIERLKDDVLYAEWKLSSERARLVTEAYRRHESDSTVLKRAKALGYLLENMTISIRDGELILGNVAESPHAAPFYPECAVEWLEEELNGKPYPFDARPGDRHGVSEGVKNELLALIPYWKGRTHHDRAFATFPDEVKLATEIGVINGCWLLHFGGEGHTIPGHEDVLKKGLRGIIDEAKGKIDSLDLTDPADVRKRPFLQAVIIACEAAVGLAGRYAALARELAAREKDALRKKELEEMAAVCERVPEHPARTFQEALQCVYLTHAVCVLEDCPGAVSFGLMDRYLFPYYERDVRSGSIDRERALELIECFLIKANEEKFILNWADNEFFLGIGSAANLTLGGVTDTGEDGTNELSYLFLEAQACVRAPWPILTARYHDGTPDKFLMACIDVIGLGGGQPGIFSDEVIVPALMNRGFPYGDAVQYGVVGCVEPHIGGKQANRNQAGPYISLLKILEIALSGGRDPKTGRVLLPGRGDLASFASFEEVMDAFRAQLLYYQRLVVINQHLVNLSFEQNLPKPFNSALVRNCVAQAKDIGQGGAVYDMIGELEIGYANVGNALAAIKKLVFDDRAVDAGQLAHALATNFEDTRTTPTGREIRRMCLGAPKYGNGDEYVDLIVSEVQRFVSTEIVKHKNTRCHGGSSVVCGYQPSSSTVSANVPFGKFIGATPDGRKSGEATADGISPHMGTDRRGPTAVALSVAKLPNVLVSGGQLLNQKFSATALSGDGKRKLAAWIRTYEGDLKGMHVQFNVVDAATLKDAQRTPERHKGLLIRVAGYTAYFTTLSRELQDVIIARTEQAF
jgi:pyruvate formate-lyase/glycerol dehydratase family glycyl radical enzyme